MTSTNASSSKEPKNTLKLDDETSEKRPQQAQVTGLEEDDEFEEFEVQGAKAIYPSVPKYTDRIYYRATTFSFVDAFH